ncbi:hypothetical protein HanRHA438_Chr12g0541481 [Helianthus annuus]|nr:hypothetical protein HanRHA438_Chr12g0541481 [Helianthus annuus]
MFLISSRVFPAILRLIPFKEASRHTFVKSSPLYPSVRRATSSMSTFHLSIFVNTTPLKSQTLRVVRTMRIPTFRASWDTIFCTNVDENIINTSVKKNCRVGSLA